jgi:class 3 adenylate cyclase/predicted ATPase
VICSNCATENAAGRKFCKNCGTPLASICPSCGAANDADARFCGECGTALMPAERAPTSAPSTRPPGEYPAAGAATLSGDGPASERRLVSILFADLVGFTPFAEERDAEDVRETLSRYFQIASDVIGRYGGVVEKFIGDAVMAVWGAPTAQEDDAERAVRAALELVETVRTLGPGIEARGGVLTGEAAVTIGATNQGMVAGDLVNTAARLQSVAPAGTVLVGEATHRAAASAITFEEAGPQVLKGKTAPIPAWRALRVVAQRGGQGRSDLPEPPFVGREEEMHLLREAVNATGRERRTRLVSITGPGGIGKSRLAWELEKYIDGVTEPIYWHRGRSPAYGEGITFWALGEMVRRRAHLAETDDEATTRARVAETVAEYVTDPSDRRWVEPALLTLLGLEPAPAGGRDVLFAAWRIFFERIALNGTVVLLFEDLQWADTGLLDFIDHVMDWSKGVPILIVTLARPELFDRRPDWGIGHRAYSALALEPLPEAAMRELLAGFVPGLSAAAVDSIVRRADGIPLYAVETVRALVTDGRLELQDGVYRPIGELGELAIPETLRSLIASRLDALEASDRSLVQDASVLGQTVTVAGLSAITGRGEDELERRLRALVRRELFELEADPRSPERGQYRFVQSLIREVAYGTLARRERRQRHIAVARYFEAAGDDELAGALANHYLAAHEASAVGAEADAVAAQARLALRAAAERAATLGATDQAVAFLRQALEVTTDPVDRADLQLRAAASATAAGAHDEAEVFARAAVDDYRLAGDEPAAARARAELGAVLLNATKLDTAVTVLEHALSELAADAPGDVRARVLANLSRAYMRNSAYDAALDAADRALDLAEPLGLEEVIANALNNRGSVLGSRGRYREAMAIMSAAVEIAAAGGYVDAEMRARSNQASHSFELSPRRATELQWANLELAQRVGHQGMAIWIGSQAISGSWMCGLDWDAALSMADELLTVARSGVDESRILGSEAGIRNARGESTDRHLARIREIADGSGAAELIANVHSLVADRARYGGDFRTAVAEFIVAAESYEGLAGPYLASAIPPAVMLGDADELRRLVRRLEALPDSSGRLNAAIIALGRAAILALDGRTDEATGGFRAGWGELGDLGADFFRAEAILVGVTLLGPITSEVRTAAGEARLVFERLRARPYLAWLEDALERPRENEGRTVRASRRAAPDPIEGR